MDARVSAAFVGLAGVPGHNVGIDVDGVNRIGDSQAVFMPEDVENVAAIAFGAVRNEDFVISDLDAAVPVIVLSDDVPEKLVALLGAVSAKSGANGHFIDRRMQGRNDRGRQRFGDIANAATDHASGHSGVGFTEGFHAPGNLGKEVTGFEFQIVVVEIRHGRECIQGSRWIDKERRRTTAPLSTGKLRFGGPRALQSASRNPSKHAHGPCVPRQGPHA